MLGPNANRSSLKEKQERLLNLYLEGNLPQASYVVKNAQLEKEAETLARTRTSLQQKIDSNGKATGLTDLIQTLRLLARSHRRFTEEQKTKVFRSIIKEARLTASGCRVGDVRPADAECLVEIPAEEGGIPHGPRRESNHSDPNQAGTGAVLNRFTCPRYRQYIQVKLRLCSPEGDSRLQSCIHLKLNEAGTFRSESPCLLARHSEKHFVPAIG